MAQVYKSEANDAVINMMDNDQNRNEADFMKSPVNSDRNTLRGENTSPATVQGAGLTGTTAAKSFGEDHSEKKHGLMSKIKGKAVHMKEVIKREFGHSDPSGANEQPVATGEKTSGVSGLKEKALRAKDAIMKDSATQSKDATLKEKAMHAKDAITKEFGRKSPVSTTPQQLGTPAAPPAFESSASPASTTAEQLGTNPARSATESTAAESNGLPNAFGKSVPEGMDVPIIGDATPLAGVQTGVSSKESESQNREVLGKDFDFPSLNEDAVSGKDEKTAADILKGYVTELQQGGQWDSTATPGVHGLTTPIDTSAATEPATEMIGATSPFEPPLHSRSRELKEVPTLSEDSPPLEDTLAAPTPLVQTRDSKVPSNIEKSKFNSLQDEINDHLGHVPPSANTDNASGTGKGILGKAGEGLNSRDFQPAVDQAEKPKFSSLQDEINDHLGHIAPSANTENASGTKTGILGKNGEGVNLRDFQPALDQSPEGGAGSVTGGAFGSGPATTDNAPGVESAGATDEKKPTTLIGVVESYLSPVLGSLTTKHTDASATHTAGSTPGTQTTGSTTTA